MSNTRRLLPKYDQPRVGPSAETPGRNVLLVNYSGYPDYTSYFLVENGLAFLSAVLREHGHRVLLRDYVTLSVAERLYEPSLMSTVIRSRDQCQSEILRDGVLTDRSLATARDVELRVLEHNLRVADELVSELSQDIVARGIELVAVKLWTQPSLRQVYHIVAQLRSRHPHVRFLAGGAHVDYFRERVLGHSGAFDAAAYAHGERAILGYLEWMAGRRALADVPNLLYRDPGGRIRDSETRVLTGFAMTEVYPAYDSDVYPVMASISDKMKTIAFEDSRGCQHSCGFCAHPVKSGKLSLRSAESVVDELQFMNAKYGFISFTGAGSNTPFVHACRIYASLKARNVDVAVNFFQSLRDFKLTDAAVMRQSHIPLLWIGIESAAPDMLAESYDKRRDMAHTRAVCSFLNDARIGYITSLIYPSLGETADTRDATLQFIGEVAAGHVVIYPPLLQPGTPWMRHGRVDWLDRESYLNESQFGLEEVENGVLPPMVTNRALNDSVRINGHSYASIYAQTVRFRADVDLVCNGARGHKRALFCTDALEVFMRRLNNAFVVVDDALVKGTFAAAKEAMAAFNDVATSGSVAARASARGALGPSTGWPALRTGGPA